MTGLVNGDTYSFKIESRNSYSYSEYSDVLTLLVATVPDKVANPVTAVSGSDITITWVTPIENGSPISAYRIEVLQKDGGYSQDTVNCDGADQAIVDS